MVEATCRLCLGCSAVLVPSHDLDDICRDNIFCLVGFIEVPWGFVLVLSAQVHEVQTPLIRDIAHVVEREEATVDKHLSLVDDVTGKAVMGEAPGLVSIGGIHPDPLKGRQCQDVDIVKADAALFLTGASIEVAENRQPPDQLIPTGGYLHVV